MGAKCNTQYCESWVNWQPWSSCANPNGATCGNGDRIRVRECTGQPGAPGCRGSGLESAKCVISTCQWSDWLPRSSCSASCGQGTATFPRACPIPGQCPGADRKTDKCSQALCPGFQNWGEWSECSATCGSGTTRRTRECNGTINIDCRGSVDQRKPCSKPACPNQYDSSQILMVTSTECQATVIKMYFKNFSATIISSPITDKLLILVILVSVRITPLVRIPVM